MQQRKCFQLYDRYRIESEIGRGASGVCYRVQNIKSKQLLAMKKIHITSIKKSNTKQACSEVAILSKLNHPNIIKLLEFFTDESYLYIIMQYAPKGDLHNILKKRRIRRDIYSEQQIWQMARQLLTALEYLHGQSIIHRDVKTLNIFMDLQGKLYLGDLGVSKILKADGGLYSRVGTPLYLAPEIIRYEKYDYKADVWGLGCVCYQLATLNHPFEGKNIISLGQNIVNVQPKPIESYSIELNSFIMDMLEKNPNKRLGAGELIKKYFQGGKSETPKLLLTLQEMNGRPALERSSNLLKSNLIRRKVINNFLEEKILFDEGDRIKEETGKDFKKIIFREGQGRDNKASKITEKSMEDTLVFTKKMKSGQENKKYVEATHKTYLAVRSIPVVDDKPNNNGNKSNCFIDKSLEKVDSVAFVQFSSEKEGKKEMIKPTTGTLPSFSSDKRLGVVSVNLPNSNSSARGFYAPCHSSIEPGEGGNRRVDTSCADINRLSSENQLQGPAKVSRMRPKSSIMTKQRHQITMKNIKKSVRRGESEFIDKIVETRVLKRPEMIIL